MNETSGILSAIYNGETRPICDKYFTINEARVACYELYQTSYVISYNIA